MKTTLRIGQAAVTLSDANYLAAGGEAAVYKNGAEAIKLYHDPKRAMSLGKIKELALINAHNVIRPLEPAYDASGNCVGYSMKYLAGTEPLCKFFTKSFKVERSVTPAQLDALLKAMQLTLSEVHRAKCLVVDLNELNILVDANSLSAPFFIDTDSYQTPSFKATAIMASVRDHNVPHGTFTELTDWYSWGVLAFQIYINIHPYQGKHPNYRPNEWEKRMEKGVSVFDKAVRLPPVCNPFSVIPKRHLDWFEAVFARNERSVPPLADSIAPLAVPKAIVTIRAHEKLSVTELRSIGAEIIDVFVLRGITHCVTKSFVKVGSAKMQIDVTGARKVVVGASSARAIVGLWNGNSITFKTLDGTMVGTGSGSAIFARNEVIYAQVGGRLMQYSFIEMGTRTIIQMKEVENISALATKVFDGALIQDLLGRAYVTVPYAVSRCATKPCPALNGWRVIEAAGVRNWVVVLAEQKGRYDRFILKFADDWQSLAVHMRDEDVAYEAVNFTTTSSGTCLLLTEDTLRVWNVAWSGRVRVFDNPPVEAGMKLFSIDNSVAFIHDDVICQLTLHP